MNIAFIGCLFVASLQWYNVEATLDTIEIKSFLTSEQQNGLHDRSNAISNGKKALRVTATEGVVKKFTQTLKLTPITGKTEVQIQVKKVRYSNAADIDTIQFSLMEVTESDPEIIDMGSQSTVVTDGWNTFETTAASGEASKRAGTYELVMEIEGDVEIDNIELELTNQDSKVNYIKAATYSG